MSACSSANCISPSNGLMSYYGVDGSGVHLPFNFHLILTTPWNARANRGLDHQLRGSAALLRLAQLGAWQPRPASPASRIGPRQARVAAMLLLTLRGTPTLYYGDELGMHDVAIPTELVQDPWEKNVPGWAWP